MGALVLVTGVVSRAPERKVSKSGNEYAMMTVRMKEGDVTHWWTVLAFSDVAADVLALKDGDFVTVRGSMKAEIYERDGASKLGLKVLADGVLSLRQS